MDATVHMRYCRQRICIPNLATVRTAAAPVSAVSARRPRSSSAAAARRHPTHLNSRSAGLHQHGVGHPTKRRDGSRGHRHQIAASAATWDEQTPPEGVVAAVEADDSAAGKITFVQAVSNTLNIMVRRMCTVSPTAPPSSRGSPARRRHCDMGPCTQLEGRHACVTCTHGHRQVGVGLLSIPYAMRQAGWVGLALLYTLGAIACYTGVFASTLCASHKVLQLPHNTAARVRQ